MGIEQLERLNIDFWRYEIENKGFYIPKPFLSKIILK
jgi:hypothetical protein